MKFNLITLFGLIFTLQTFAQNEPELIQEYASESHAKFVLIDHDMPKLLVSTTDQFYLYNLDFTIYTTFSYPASYTSYNTEPTYLSRSLFDCDTTQLEYMFFTTDSEGINYVKILREDGTELFSLANYTYMAFSFPNDHYRNEVSTEDGTYITLTRGFLNDTTRLYKFCGQLPQMSARNMQGEVITGLTGSNAERPSFKISPNPGKDQIKLEYDLEGSNGGTVNILSLTGQLVKEVRIGPAFKYINLNISGLKAGTYIARIVSDEGFQLSEKFVKVN